jgi:ParB family chromosome partitioning protein
MSAKHVGLGRGLGALIKDSATTEPAPPPAAPAAAGGGPLRIPLDRIRKSPWQPRRVFAPEAFSELVQSVKERGVLQPLLVRRAGTDHYELIAGERRFRAAQEAGQSDVPAVIMDVSDREALEIALVENLQREDLNPIEEAEGYQALLDKFHMTQEQIAERVGKARATVANALRLLGLPATVRQAVAEGRLPGGHAKVILGLEIAREQELLAERVLEEGLSVRALERIVARLKSPPKKPRAEKADLPASHLQYLSDRLHQHLGTRIRVTPCRTLSSGKKAPGAIEIEFYSNEELDRILAILGISETL